MHKESDNAQWEAIAGDYDVRVGDIDLLVEKKNILDVDKALRKNGFLQGQLNDKYVFEPASRKDVLFWTLNFHQEHKYTKPSIYEYVSPYNQIYVDVNTSIFEGGSKTDPITTNTLLNSYRTQKVSCDCKIRTLSITYELIQLCYHFYKDSEYPIRKKNHTNYSLMHFCDIREYILLYFDKIDWDELYNIIYNNLIVSQVFFSLSMVNNFYSDLNIDFFLKRIRPEIEPYVLSKLTDDWEKLFLRY